MLTQSRLKQLLHYDPDTGVFTWLANRGRKAKTGGMAGSINTCGHRQIKIGGRAYMAHRLAWLYVHGAWPKDQTDHINGVRDDNRIANLREATQSENNQNVAMYSNNTSGFIGVSWFPATMKWKAQIKVNGGVKHIGYFDMPEAAHAAYLAAKAELHTFNPCVREQSK